MKKVFFNFQDPVNSYPLNERNMGVLKPGRYKGFNRIEKESAGVYIVKHSKPYLQVTKPLNTEDLLNSLANYSQVNLGGKVTQDKNSLIDYGVYIMPTGVMVHDTDDIKVNITQNDLTGNRYDLLVVSHEYLDIPGGSSPIYEIIKGIEEDKLPLLPSQDKKIALGIFEVPKGNINTVSVRYLPFISPMVGDLELETILNLSADNIKLPIGTDKVRGIVKFSTQEESASEGNNSTAMTPQNFYNNKSTTNKRGVVKIAATGSYKQKPSIPENKEAVVTIGDLHDNLPIMNNDTIRLTSNQYILKPEDNGKILLGFMSNGSTNVIVPTGLGERFHVGFIYCTSNINIVRQGTTIIRKANSEGRLAEQGSSMLLNSTGVLNEFVLTGDLFDTRYN